MLLGRPRIMWPVFLLSRPRMQKCLHIVAEKQGLSESPCVKRWEERSFVKMVKTGRKETRDNKKKIAESVFGIMAGNRTKGGKTGK